MNYKDINLYNEDQPLILKNEVKTESGALQTNKLKQEISKIKNITNGINKNIKNNKSKINEEQEERKKEERKEREEEGGIEGEDSKEVNDVQK